MGFQIIGCLYSWGMGHNGPQPPGAALSVQHQMHPGATRSAQYCVYVYCTFFTQVPRAAPVVNFPLADEFVFVAAVQAPQEIVNRSISFIRTHTWGPYHRV